MTFKKCYCGNRVCWTCDDRWLHTTTSKNVFTRSRKLFCLIDHHLSTKGRWCLLDLIGLFVSTCFNVRAFPLPCYPPTSTSENFFTPFLQDCSQPIANTSLRTYLCFVTVANFQPSTRQRTGLPRYPIDSRVWLYSRSYEA